MNDFGNKIETFMWNLTQTERWARHACGRAQCLLCQVIIREYLHITFTDTKNVPRKTSGASSGNGDAPYTRLTVVDVSGRASADSVRTLIL